MKLKYLVLTIIGISFAFSSFADYSPSTRRERRAIKSGNALYEEGKYGEAIREYNLALKDNPQSETARFNIAMSQFGLAKKNEANDTLSQRLMQNGMQLLQSVTQSQEARPDLKSKAFYNLGNLQFESENYAGAIAYYKSALRLNPNFEEARRNLRIAQLKQKKDNNGGGSDNKEDEQEQQEQQQEQDQQQNQDQQQQEDKQDQQPPKENELNPQTAEQILNAVENNENQTRSRKGNPLGEESKGGSARYKW